MNPMLLTNVMDYSKPIEGFSDKLTFGGTILLIGMAAVFAVLFIIFISLKLFAVVFKNASDKKTEVSVNTVTPTPAPTDASNADEEIIAAIAAAIAMAESESSGVKFRVVSFRRV